MKIHFAIATTGRPEILKQVISRLSQQTRPADGIVIVGAHPDDVSGLDPEQHDAEVMVSSRGRGLCKQRNAALDWLEGRSDVVLFVDDDFVPANDYIENLEKLFREEPDVIGATGILIADGAHTQPIAFDAAVEMLEARDLRPKPKSQDCNWLYGCNMAIRLNATAGLRFDEDLPLYGWHEDVDFSHQLSWRGKMVRTSELTGVHLGTRSGRTSGRRFGYSQVANIIYLVRKGTIARGQGEMQLLRNVVANIVRSLWSEPDIDRRGRLAGNLIAFADLLRGRIDPRRIEAL